MWDDHHVYQKTPLEQGRSVVTGYLGTHFLGRKQCLRPERWNLRLRGAQFCGVCHGPKTNNEYASWSQHGHAWMEVHIGGQAPTTNPFQYVGVALPPLPTGVTWSQVADIVANFKTDDGSTAAFLLSNGNLVESTGSQVKPMPAKCNNCHNTGVNMAGTGGNIAYGNLYPGIQGSWARNGIQCEQCHGPAPRCKFPLWVSAGTATHQVIRCTGFHSASSEMLFTNHHPQGDEYRRSPHKALGCTLCHDPHKSVWHNQGGVLYTAGIAPGNMCTQCHTERVRTVMGQLGLVCTDCHMPEVSAGGTRAAHLFKINPANLSAAQNVVTQSGTAYWANLNEPSNPTDPNGNAALTLDLVCTKCHSNQTVAMMSSFAPYIHRAFGMVGLTANGAESSLLVKQKQKVTVNFSVIPDARLGMKANWYVMLQSPTGWSSWNGTRWVAGQRPWRKNYPLAEVPSQTVYNATMKPGHYTFWVSIYPTDGSQTIGSVAVSVIH